MRSLHAMGIEGRDYFRDSSPYTDRLTGWGWVAVPPVCKWLIIINIVVFLLQIFVTRQPRRQDLEAYLQQYKELYREAPEDDSPGNLPDFSYLSQISVVEEWLQLETH